MADSTTFRLDTADIAIEAGWQLESMSRIAVRPSRCSTTPTTRSSASPVPGRAAPTMFSAPTFPESLSGCGSGSACAQQRARMTNGLPDIPFEQDRRVGCWTLNSFVEAKGPETAVTVAGLDADEVWAVGEKVSQAIN